MSEMSWCNALQRTGSDFCATDNFQGTLMTRHINLIKDFDIRKYLFFGWLDRAWCGESMGVNIVA